MGPVGADRHQEFIRFLNTSRRRCRREWRSTRSQTTMRPTSIQRCANGSCGIQVWTFHFTRPRHPGSMRFAKLARRRLKRGVFGSLADLQAAIKRFLGEINSDPKPFIWTNDPKHVLAAVNRGKQTLELVH